MGNFSLLSIAKKQVITRSFLIAESACRPSHVRASNGMARSKTHQIPFILSCSRATITRRSVEQQLERQGTVQELRSGANTPVWAFNDQSLETMVDSYRLTDVEHKGVATWKGERSVGVKAGRESIYSSHEGTGLSLLEPLRRSFPTPEHKRAFVGSFPSKGWLLHPHLCAERQRNRPPLSNLVFQGKTSDLLLTGA